jgi:hypothetical protein
MGSQIYVNPQTLIWFMTLYLMENRHLLQFYFDIVMFPVNA